MKWGALAEEVGWQVRRLGAMKFYNILYLWLFGWALWTLGLEQVGYEPLVAAFISVYLGEASAGVLMVAMAYLALRPSFIDYAFARTLLSKNRKSFLLRASWTWEYARWLLGRRLDEDFGDAFLLKTVRDDATVPKEEQPATSNAMLWAAVMELIEQASGDDPPWNRTTTLLADLRAAFRSKQMSEGFRTSLTNAYGRVERPFREAAAKSDAGKPRDFVTAHPVLILAIITIVASAIGGVINLIPSLLK